jgi:competence protein ComEC
MLSHRDTDHTGGARAVLQMQPQARLISSLEDRHELLSLADAGRCQAGQRWEWDGVLFQVLHPLPGDYQQAARPNAMSCVLRISNAQGRAAALLVGDIELPQEAALLARGVPLAADVLLVPHHGSKTSSGTAFLEQVHPGLGLVQSGYRNRFGHPAPPVTQRYQALGVRLVDSPHCGAARWTSLQPADVICQREQDLRYWHHSVP